LDRNPAALASVPQGLSSDKAYFEQMSQVSTIGIQLHREKRRSEQLYDELCAVRASMNVDSDKKSGAVQALNRQNHELQTEVSHLAAKVLDLELSLNSERKAGEHRGEEFGRVKAAFEKQLADYHRTTTSTIVKAEESLEHYNDEWARRLETERMAWVKKMREKEEMSEHNLMSVQSQFSDAHAFYSEHIKKMRKEKVKEEGARRELEDELAATREELGREKAARRALTQQLKKERKWREKCLHLTQQSIELRAENDEGKEEKFADEDFGDNIGGSTVQPSQYDHLDPASRTYLAAVDEYIRAEGGALPPGGPLPPTPLNSSFPPHAHRTPLHAVPSPQHSRNPYPQQSPVYPQNGALEEERRKNKLLTLELLRQRTLTHATPVIPGPSSPGGWSNMSSPTHTMHTQQTERTSPYFPLGSPTTYGMMPVNDREVAALRVAVERADIERVLEAEIGIERAMEQDNYKVQLDEERKMSEEREKRLREVERKAEEERKEWIEKEQKRSSAIGDVLKSSEKMYMELESEKERNKLMESALRREFEEERLEMTRKLNQSKTELDRVRDEQSMALKESRRMMAGSGVVPDEENVGKRKVGQGGRRGSVENSVPDVGGPQDWKMRFNMEENEHNYNEVAESE
jgi:hypothetical protein